MSNVDPGGGDDGGRSSTSGLQQAPDLSNLQENFNEQQTKILALKELVRQSEADQGKTTANAKEKVKNIAQRLNHLKAKASRGRHSEKSFSEIEEEMVVTTQTTITRNRIDSESHAADSSQFSLSSVSVPTTPLPLRARSETPGSEKIQLLRQQMEQNRLKMAERENSNRGIEKLVTQLKAKFDSSQLSLDKAHLGRSVGDLSNLPGSGVIPSKHQSTGDLSSGFNLERERIKYLEKRVRQLEAEIKTKEKEFFNKDPGSEHLKMIKVLEETVLDLEENLKEKDDVIHAKTQAANLISESLSLKGKSTVDLLEDTKQEMFSMQTNFMLIEEELKAEIERLSKESQQKDNKIANLEEHNDILETARFDLTVQNSELVKQNENVEENAEELNELNKLNEALRQQVESLKVTQKDEDGSVKNQRTVEDTLTIQDLEFTIKELQLENEDLKKSLQNAINSPITAAGVQDRITALEAELANQKESCIGHTQSLEDVQDQLTEKTIEFNVLVANFNVLQEKLKTAASKSLFSRPTDEEAHAQIKELKTKLATLTSSSDTNKTLLNKQDEINSLKEKIVQLEFDKAAILEASKMELQSRAKDNKSKEEVTSQLETIALEEKIDIGLKEAVALKQQIHQLTAEKNDLKSKLDRYITENMELLDKIDKLSKGSSAESIEIVEGLTAEEKLEMEQFQKGLEMRQQRRLQTSIIEDDDTDFIPTIPDDPSRKVSSASQDGPNTGFNQELNDNLDKLREERTELLQKIELFTAERHVVLEKMDVLKKENSKLVSIIDELRIDKLETEQCCENLRKENLDAIRRCRETEDERQDLLDNIREMSDIKTRLQDEVNLLTRERNVASAGQENFSVNQTSYDVGLKNLETELENYRKAKDKNAKFGISKKMAKEAKNVSESMAQLLDDYKRSVESFNSLQAEIEGTRLAREELDKTRLELMAEGCTNDVMSYIKNLKEKLKEQVKNQRETRDRCEELEQTVEEDRREIENLKLSIDELNSSEAREERPSLKDETNELNEKIQELEHQLNETKEYNFVEMQKQRHEFDNRVTSLHKEIDILRALVDEQKEQLITAYTENEEELQQKSKQISEYEIQVKDLQIDLDRATKQMSTVNEEYVNSLTEKINSMKFLLDENSELLSSQMADLANKQETIETLNRQIMDLYAAMEQQGSDLNDKEDEINRVQESVDELVKEIRILKERTQSYEKRIKDVEGQLAEKEKEIVTVTADLAAKNKEQLEKLKKFAANLKKKNAQYSDLEIKYKELEMMKENRSVIVDDSFENVKEQKQEILQLRQELQQLQIERKTENAQVQQSSAPADQDEIGEMKYAIATLESIVEEKEAQIVKLTKNLDHEHAELENIKLRLSEKVQLVDQFTSETQKMRSEIIELRDSLGELSTLKEEFTSTSEDLKSKNIKIEKCKAIIKEKNKEIKRLKDQVQTLMDQQLPQTDLEDSNSEIERLKRDHSNVQQEYEQYKSSIEAKLQESALFIETLENDNTQLKDRIGRLEESICVAEERRLSLEMHSELLGSQLQQKQTQIENVEDEYMGRLQAIVGQDEIIEQKLKELEKERDNLVENLKELQYQSSEASRQNSLLQSHVTELETVKLSELESDNRSLAHKVEKLESDLQKQKTEFDQALKTKQAEFVDLENELSAHLNEVEKERRAQQEILEKCRDENALLQEEINRLRDSQHQLEQTRTDLGNQLTWLQMQTDNQTQDQQETQELRMQAIQDQTEIENLRTQNNELARDHEAALNAMRQQLSDLQAANDALISNHEMNIISIRNEAASEIESVISQYQEAIRERESVETAYKVEIATTKDQIASELESLKTQVCHDQTDIVNLRLQNQQLIADHGNELNALRNRIAELTSIQLHVEQDQLEVQHLRVQIGNDQTEIEHLRAQKQQLDNELSVLRQQITALDSMQMQVGQNITQDQLEVQQLRTQVGHDQTEIEALRVHMQQLTAAHDIELAALRQQIAELDSLRMQVGQNQTDDQVFIQNENERLQSVLAEKELEIQNYQRQNLQLQMSAGFTDSASGTSHDPFAAINIGASAAEVTEPDNTSLINKVTELETQLEAALHDAAERLAKIQELEMTLGFYTVDNPNDLSAKCLSLQRQCCEKDVEIARLQDIHQHLLSSLPADQEHTEDFVTTRHVIGSNTEPTVASNSFSDNINNTYLEVPPSVEHHDQQIEDLQRNVSDLEKYATDLEHRLKLSTEENHKYLNERFILENNLSTKTKQYEERIASLDQQISGLKEELAMTQADSLLVQSSSLVVTPISQPKIEPQPLSSTAMFFTSSGDASEDPFEKVVAISDVSDTVDSDGRKPVVEEIIVPKKAYLCHPNDKEEGHILSPLGSQDALDDAVWGGDDAALEEEHQRMTTFVDNQSKISEINQQIQIDEITTERDRLQAELNSFQSKYAKIFKKLREYKTKNDEFERSNRKSSVVTSDLDLAIQEELNSQIKTLEQRYKEVKLEQEKEAMEKKKLLSRIDVLTAANDRMCEMKDKQDIEIEVCKTKVRELNGKLEQLNSWGDDTPTSGDPAQNGLAERLAEAQNQNRVLEERIARLQESVDEKDDFEEEREKLNDGLRLLETERDTLTKTIQQYEEEIATLKEKVFSLEAQNQDYCTTIDILSVESNNIKTYLDRLKDEHKQKIDENNNLSENLKSLDSRNLELSRQIEEMRVYNLGVQDIEQRIQDLTATVQYKESEIANLNERIESDKKEFEEALNRLKAEKQDNEQVIAEFRAQCEELSTARSHLESLVDNKEKSVEVELDTNNIQQEQIIADLKAENLQMEHELEVLNAQILKNLEIEGKMKSTVLELDMKTIEISELKNSLEQLRDQQLQQLPTGEAKDLNEKLNALENTLKEQENYHQSTINQINEQWQEKVEQKCSELADSWRQHLLTRESDFSLIENDLRQQLAELEVRLEHQASSTKEALISQEPIPGPSTKPEEQSDTTKIISPEMAERMQKALEVQEMEIVSLKEQLAMRSAQYARIAAQVDPYGEWASLANTTRSDSSQASTEKGKELDIALYMLHQRDMRCEELKMEVINLLEERDSLQSKLAGSIRQMEDLKHSTRVVDGTTKSSLK